MNTDAALGHSRKGYQGDVIATANRNAGKFILARLEGTAAKAYAAPKTELTPRDKVGYRPRRTRATQIAVPPRCELGENGVFQEGVLALLKSHGPWAPRRLASRKYARNTGELSKSRDWAAESLNIPVPEHLYARLILTTLYMCILLSRV